jgi:DDE superfamily endonuclease
MKLNAAPTQTLVASGEKEYVVVEDTSSYAKRYDMIACITSKEVLPPIIYTPDDRKAHNAKGINTDMLIIYIQQILAQAAGALDRYPLYLIIDNATCHSKAKLLEAFHDNGCQELVDIWFMPTQAAKRMSPLDNSLFHEWKERVRSRHPITESNITQLMSDEWNNLPPQHISHYYTHCGLTGQGNAYLDCPNPSVHNHKQ